MSTVPTRSGYTLCVAVEYSPGSLSPVLYVIILSAALDLVPASTPKGLIAFCNIAPSFVAKIVWPYLLKGTVRYHQRIVGCCIMSVLGMIVSGGAVAPYCIYPKLECGIPSDRCPVRWSGDEAARHFHRVFLFRSVQPCSLSTVAEDDHTAGLGGLTLLQLTTTYPSSIAGRNIGHVFLEKNQRCARSERFRLIQIFRVRNRCCWARRCTPLVGAPKPWCAISPGVFVGKNSTVYRCALLIAVITKVLPLTIPLVYFLLLPHPSSVFDQDEEGDGVELFVTSPAEYAPLPTDEDEGTTAGYRRSRIVALSANDKWQLVKPMIPKYMLPLCKYLFVRL